MTEGSITGHMVTSSTNLILLINELNSRCDSGLKFMSRRWRRSGVISSTLSQGRALLKSFATSDRCCKSIAITGPNICPETNHVISTARCTTALLFLLRNLEKGPTVTSGAATSSIPSALGHVVSLCQKPTQGIRCDQTYMKANDRHGLLCRVLTSPQGGTVIAL